MSFRSWSGRSVIAISADESQLNEAPLDINV